MKLILKLLAGIVGLFVVAVIAIIALVDPNDFKDDITKVVEEQTGRQFEMSSIELSLFPNIGLNLKGAQLSNAQGFSQAPFAAIQEVKIGAALMPLFSQELVVDNLTLKGLQLSLEKNAEGKTNWQDFAKGSETQEAQKPMDEKQDSGSPMQALQSLQFGGLNIENANIQWKDDATKQVVSIEGLNANTGAVSLNTFFPINLSTKTELQSPKLQSDLKVSMQLKLQEDGNIAIKDFALNNQIVSNELPFKRLNSELVLAEIFADLNSQTFSGEGLQLTTKMDAEQFGLSASETAIMVKTGFLVDLAKQTANLADLELMALGTQTSGSVSVTSMIDSPIVNASLKTSEFNLKSLLAKLNVQLPEMASQTAISKVTQQMQMTFDVNNQALKISKLNVSLDNSTLSGNSSVSNFANPAIKFNLALDKINVNDYLPPKSEVAPAPETDAKKSEDVTIELPKELMRSLDIAGKLTIGDLTFDKLNAKNILVELKAKNGKIDVAPANADIFGTNVTLTTSVDVRTQTTKYAATVKAPKVPVGDVLLAFMEKDPLTGLGSVDIDITSQGESVKALMAAVSGKADIDLADGAVKGFNLAQSIRTAKDTISGKTTPASNEPLQTDFSELVAKVTMKNGLVTTKEVNALAPFMRVNADGTADLAKDALNMVVKTKIVATSKGQGGEGLEDLNGLTIPVKLTGNLYDPSISLDLKALLDAKAKQKLDEKKEELKSKAEEKLKDKLQNNENIQNLFKGLKF